MENLAPHSGNVHEEKRSNLFSQNAYGEIMKGKDHTRMGGKGDYAKAEMIYSYDLDQVISILKQTALTKGDKASHEFYFACLDRLDILITERNSVVKKDEVVRILRELAYFRPRDYHKAEKARKSAGIFTISEM